MLSVLISVILLALPFYSSTQKYGISNERPIIGVLTEDLYASKHNYTAYIAASYVKFLESAGARVVPVMINQAPQEYKRLFHSINGILYPGGGADSISSGYAKAAKIFYDLALEANDGGDYFPVWGTCLGFQQLAYLTSAELKLTHTNTSGMSLPLNFTEAIRVGRMFKGFPADVMQDLSKLPLTVNSHNWSLDVLTYKTNPVLKKFYRVLSTNTDGEVEFVSSMEAYDYPFYGTQWHPEKNAFEWNHPYIPHSAAAAKTTFYVAEFFVSEARKSSHRFETQEEEAKALIYNYNPVYSGPKGTFMQVYYF